MSWADRIEENWCSWAKQFLHIFQRLERDPEIPHRSWQADENLACDWVTATSRTSTLSEQTMESYMREVCDDSQRSTAGQTRISSQSLRPHRSRGRRQPMMQQILEQYQKHTNTRTRTKKRTTTMVRTNHHPTSQTTEGEMLSEPDTTATSSSDRGEKRTESQENVFVKRRRMTKSPNRPITICPTS